MHLRWLYPAPLLLAFTVLVRPAVVNDVSALDPAQGKSSALLVGKISDEDLIALSTALAARQHPGHLLLDTDKTRSQLKDLLTALSVQQVMALGEFEDSSRDLAARLGKPVAAMLSWNKGVPEVFWNTLFPKAECVVVCPAKPRELLLQAACLAGSRKAPLWVVRDAESDFGRLKRQLNKWKTKEIIHVGSATPDLEIYGRRKVTILPDEDQVFEATIPALRKHGPIRAIAVTNPADALKPELGRTSLLAPWVTLQRQAVLRSTNETGTNATSRVQAVLDHPELHRADNLILLATPRAIPMGRRPNPAPGKDTFIEMEPLTPDGTEPCTFATGRLFHEDLGVLTLMWARQQLLLSQANAHAHPKVVIASNPGGGLDLLETFSRFTTREFQNRGYDVTAMFEDEVQPYELRRQMPQADIFLWEGHYRTLVDRFGFASWNEPLRPSFIFLQSCLALNEIDAQPLLQRGAIGIVGSSTRIYSGSGGAFTLAFFDSLLYEKQSLGGALRQAKNFLAAYAQLKEKRLGMTAKLGGANTRSAWAFTLWGDPTLRLPQPEAPKDMLPAVETHQRGKTVTLCIPDEAHPYLVNRSYQAKMWPNARLAGLVTKVPDENERKLAPLLYTEVSLPNCPEGKTPELRTKLPARNWVFNWDARRKVGALLVLPRARDHGEVVFRFDT